MLHYYKYMSFSHRAEFCIQWISVTLMGIHVAALQATRIFPHLTGLKAFLSPFTRPFSRLWKLLYSPSSELTSEMKIYQLAQRSSAVVLEGRIKTNLQTKKWISQIYKQKSSMRLTHAAAIQKFKAQRQKNSWVLQLIVCNQSFKCLIKEL